MYGAEFEPKFAAVRIVKRITVALSLVRYLGAWWVIFRFWYSIRRRAGFLERAMPRFEWPPIKLIHRPRIFKIPLNIGDRCIGEAENIAAGKFIIFSAHCVDVGIPPDWHRNQMTGKQVEGTTHWSRLEDFAFGDIKAVWELSRFSWAFALARAYAKTGNEKYAEIFWGLFENWMVHNPPNQGPNWMCGQEASFRLMAITFAVDVLTSANASTIKRKTLYSTFVIATGKRIAGNLDYALSQSNNHGISEAIGLVTAALLSHGYCEAESWRQRGIVALEQQLAKLVYPDGAFSQHSAIYHRVLIHNLLWIRTLMEAFGEPINDSLCDVALKAVRFIESLMTFETGAVPLYGASDGTNILQLADSNYGDFRPIVQAGNAAFGGERVLESGPWDEMVEWLVGPIVMGVGVASRIHEAGRSNTGNRIHYSDGGCLVWRHGSSRLFFRCPTSFQHRPSHADLLHVDFEWKGIPIAIDAGTFSYNTHSVPSGDMKEAKVHNTITFRGKEPMEKISRFLYLPWPRGRSGWDGPNRFVAEHDGWARFGCRHVRTIEPYEDDGFIVIDDLFSATASMARIHWMLPDLPYRLSAEKSHLVLITPSGEVIIEWSFSTVAVEVVRGAVGGSRGWISPRYFERIPALSLTFDVRCSESHRGWTRFTPMPR